MTGRCVVRISAAETSDAHRGVPLGGNQRRLRGEGLLARMPSLYRIDLGVGGPRKLAWMQCLTYIFRIYSLNLILLPENCINSLNLALKKSTESVEEYILLILSLRDEEFEYFWDLYDHPLI